jgi:hypothetical protein
VRNEDGNSLASGDAKLVDGASSRDQSDREHFPKSFNGPVDLDAPSAESETEQGLRDLRQRDAQWALRQEQEQHQEAARAQQEQETAVARQQIEQHIREQVEQQYRQRLAERLLPNAKKFEAIKTVEDAQLLQQRDPQAFAEFQEFAAEAQRLLGDEELHAHRRREAQAQQKEQEAQARADWGSEQDRLFYERTPETRDPQKFRELREAAMSTLRNVGYSDQELSQGWHETGFLRDARAQEVVKKAALWDLAQAKARAAVPKAAPRPFMPGGGGDHRAIDGSLKSIADSGNMEAYIRAREKQDAQRNSFRVVGRRG